MSFAREVWEAFSKVDVSDRTETKQRFTYLPWSSAHSIMMSHYPDSKWAHVDTIRHDDNTQSVVVEVIIQETGRRTEKRETLPVLNHANKPIENPNALDINNAVRRCFVKCLALHGLALYLYEGEEIPTYTETETENGIETLIELVDEPTQTRFWKACGSSDGSPLDISTVPKEKKRPALKWLKEQAA